MTDEQPTDDRWLTYVEAGELLGLSPEAVRSIARRQKWPRQSPNAIGKVVRILVPADRLRPVADRREQPVSTNGHGRLSDRSAELREIATLFMQPWQEQLERTEARARAAEARAQEAEKRLQELTEQLATEQARRAGDKESADQADHRAETAERRAKEAEQRIQTAESRMRELQEQLTAEMTEHRRIIGLMAEQLSVRRSWWPWRR